MHKSSDALQSIHHIWLYATKLCSISTHSIIGVASTWTACLFKRFNEVLDHLLPIVCNDALRMKLNPLHVS